MKPIHKRRLKTAGIGFIFLAVVGTILYFVFKDNGEPKKCPGDGKCSGNGICKDDICVCNPTWGGNQCQTQDFKPCPGDSTCSGKGNCEDGICKCINGWSGDECQTNDETHCPDDCNNRGQCENGACKCKFGWKGTACETREDTPFRCPNNGVEECSGNGTCDPEAGECTCNDGFWNPACALKCSSCVNINECPDCYQSYAVLCTPNKYMVHYETWIDGELFSSTTPFEMSTSYMVPPTKDKCQLDSTMNKFQEGYPTLTVHYNDASILPTAWGQGIIGSAEMPLIPDLSTSSKFTWGTMGVGDREIAMLMIWELI